jgi:hypothetical protein
MASAQIVGKQSIGVKIKGKQMAGGGAIVIKCAQSRAVLLLPLPGSSIETSASSVCSMERRAPLLDPCLNRIE